MRKAYENSITPSRLQAAHSVLLTYRGRFLLILESGTKYKILMFAKFFVNEIIFKLFLLKKRSVSAIITIKGNICFERKGACHMSASSDFYRLTCREHLYNITHIDNIPSIIQNGIMCFDDIKYMAHHSIAMADVQRRRDSIVIPGGSRLHSYANLYFTYHNPMLYKRQSIAEDLCVLAFSYDVLDIKDCIVSDRNAAASLAKFYSAEEGIFNLDFDKIFAKFWTHDDPYEQSNHKAIKCAEILVPHCIPYDYVVKACVVSQNAKQRLLNAGFDRDITISTKVFYR